VNNLQLHRASFVLTPLGPLRDGVVEVRGGVVQAVRPARAGDPKGHRGWIIPGLVNAHLHLELSGIGRVPSGGGFLGWGKRMMAAPRPSDPSIWSAAAAGMVEAGTAGVFDVSNRGDMGPILAAAGLRGVAQRETLGWSNRPGLDERVEAAREPATDGAVRSRPGPHALYSTPPRLLVAAAAARGGVPASIHLGEDDGEAQLVRDGRGPYRGWLQHLGVPDEELSCFGRGRGLVDTLDDLGLLGPDLLVVHGVHLERGELQTLARRGVTVCLCPRSNRHIGGKLPPVSAMLAAGVPLAIGTDSTASAPDLDVLGEVAALVEACPDVEPLVWLVAATAGGSRALRRPDLGRLERGRRPGILLIDDVEDLVELVRRPPVRWLESPCPR
jgi:cytosine/adenosine deaminase-related metal-dependent hydrolase